MTAEDVGKGNLFIGKSAGAMIAALSIEYAKKKEDIRLLTPDFYNFAGFYPVPHFNAYIFEYVTLQIMQKI